MKTQPARSLFTCYPVTLKSVMVLQVGYFYSRMGASVRFNPLSQHHFQPLTLYRTQKFEYQNAGSGLIPTRIMVKPPEASKITEKNIDQYLDEGMQGLSMDFARCQANRREEVGPISGQIIVGIKVDPDGLVKEIKIIKSEITDVPIVSCIKTALTRLKVPAFEGRSVYRSYPIDFE
ncbi:MAG: hypothetical protein R2827_04580 [Bdellovibrionales bacterium]